jgi:predicted MPP superfamily phosphohydrolase
MAMTAIENTAFARLEAEGRLLNAVLKSPTHVAGRFGFRGDLAVKFAPKVADEARPPELAVDGVLAAAHEGEPTLALFTAYLWSFEHLKPVAEVLGDLLAPNGKYFLFCNNIDLLKKYKVPFGDTTFYVLPIDENTVYNEMLELLMIEKNDLKKLDTAGKHDALVNAAQGFDDDYETITYEQGLTLMGPMRNKNEGRPV